MSGTEAFLQVALVLIPALLFSTAVFGAPRRYGVIGRGAAAVMTVAALAALIIAIQGTIDPAIETWKQRYVVAVVVSGTVAAAFLAAWRPGREDASSTGRDRRAPKSLVIAIVTAGIFTAGVASLSISGSLDRASARQEWREATRERQTAASGLQRAEAEAVAARAALVSVLLQRSAVAQTFVRNRGTDAIRDIDAIVQPVLRQRTPQIESIRTARSKLRRRSDRLRAELLLGLEAILEQRAFRRKVWVQPSRSEIQKISNELFLVNLSATRFLTAERERLIATAKDAEARRRYVKVCREARAVGCRTAHDGADEPRVPATSSRPFSMA